MVGVPEGFDTPPPPNKNNIIIIINKQKTIDTLCVLWRGGGGCQFKTAKHENCLHLSDLMYFKNVYIYCV